jgi:hypothetical protein
MPSLSTSQLTLNFEPTVVERYSSLREFLAHRVQAQSKPAKTIAMDMDMSPSTLSRKLTAGLQGGDKDTQRFNVDDLEAYFAATGDAAAVIEYLAAKYLHSDEHRKTRAIARVEEIAAELARTLAALKGAA